ncbi:MAG: DUF998 domain-containing protein [Steroidobacteraceae bacterium]
MSVSSRRRVAVAAAVAATVWAAVVTLVGAAVTPGYSHVAHYISELGANGAPAGLWVSRAGFLPIGVTAFAALIASGGGRPVLRAARFCLMALPLAYLVAAFARCDAGCAGMSATQALHNFFGLLEYLGGAVALICAAVFCVSDRRRGTGVILLVLAGTVLCCLGAFGTPVQGAAQRLAEAILFGFLVFLAVETSRPATARP